MFVRVEMAVFGRLGLGVEDAWQNWKRGAKGENKEMGNEVEGEGKRGKERAKKRTRHVDSPSQKPRFQAPFPKFWGNYGSPSDSV